MKKADNITINAFKTIEKLKKRIERDASEIYSALAIVLFARGWTQDEIEDILVEIGTVWTETFESEINVCDRCQELTGIDIRDTITKTE